MNTFKITLLGVSSMFLLTACSDSNNSSGTVNGVVTGSYYEGATVFFDCNNNGIKDATETSVVSSSNGAFTLAGDSTCNIVAVIPVGAIKHEAIGDAGSVVSAKKIFATPAGTGGIISALTTRVYKKVISGSSLADAKAYVEATTGISMDDLFKNVNTITDATLKDKIKAELHGAERYLISNPIVARPSSSSSSSSSTDDSSSSSSTDDSSSSSSTDDSSSSSSSSSDDTSSSNDDTSAGSEGVAVDPYISQAKFYVVGSSSVGTDGNCATKTSFVSTVSTATGSFSFSDTVPLDATVKICQDYKGYHNGKPFDSNLSSKFDASNTDGVLSPTTTIVANGMSATDIASVLNDPNQDADFSDGVGYPDYNITAEDIYDDPMEGLATDPTDTNVTFAKIRATVALNMMMGMKGSFAMESISDMNNSGILANSITMMKKVLNTDLNANGFSADKIAQVAITVSDAIVEVIAPVIATNDANNIESNMTAATNAIPALAQDVGKQMAMNAGKSFRLRRGSASNWTTATIVEIMPSGSQLAVAGKTIEVNNERNITFYTDGSYSEVNTTAGVTYYGSYFDSDNPFGVSVETGNVNVTIIEDNVTGILDPQPTKNWQFKGDRVSLNDGDDLNITDLNSTISFYPTSQSDLNGTKIQIASGDVNASTGRTIVSRTFDINGSYKEFYGGLIYERGVWSLYEGTTTDYNVTLNGTTTDVNISYIDQGSVNVNGAQRAVTTFERLQY
ncbi:MAG: hypothetical protein JJW00_04580 [Sulfurimonas sp.]|nr:hypothetical protein [Sulfurimonas sp.]